MIHKYLQELGLSPSEVKIYLALLETGPMHISNITAKTRIHRRNVYDSIALLQEKGFVTFTLINNRRVFESLPPERLIDFLKAKEENIKMIMPDLQNLQSHSNCATQKVKVYTGIAGRKMIFEDKLNYLGEQLVLSGHWPSRVPMHFIENYHRRRIKKQIPLRILYSQSETKTANKFGNYKFITARIIPEKYNPPIAVNVYGDKVAIFTEPGNSDPLTILIEDKQVAQNFKDYFEMMWQLSTNQIS